MEKEILTVSQSSVAQALAADYFCVYYVNTDNDKFIEYSASPEYKALGLPTVGNDFISFSRSRFESILHPDDRERFLERFTKDNLIKTLHSGSTFTMTFRLMFRDIPTYVHMKVTRMYEKDGKHIVIGISSVDEQMKALEAFEKEHHASLTYSRIAQALAEDYFCIYYVDMNTDSFIEYSSSKSYKEHDIEKGGENFFELSRKNIPNVIYSEDQGALLAAFTKENILKILDEHKTFTLSYRLLLEGQPTYVNLKATRMKDEDDSHIIIGINNIDALMHQRENLRKSEEQRITYSHVAQALANDYFSIYVVDSDTDHFVEYSASREYDVLGIEKGGEDFFNLSRKNIERVIYPEDRDRFLSVFTKENLMAALEERGFFTIKYRLMFGNEPTYVSMKATLTDDRDGRHVIIGVNNIDVQMKLEMDYRKKMSEARNRARNDFLANMSHDIRTPMNAIVGYTNIAKDHIDDPEAIRDLLEKIGSSSHFLLSLINDVLDMSKIESGKMQLNSGPFDLAEVFRRIEDITSLQAWNKSLHISYDHSGITHYEVIGDELRIEQVLINIIYNAIKYTPEGKDVTLIAREEPLGDRQKNRYCFIIRDTGIGISEDYLPYIFESFTRELKTTVNQIQGTGLGLAITAKIVELMGGIISVKSKPGEGSEFTVILDLDLQDTDDAADHAESEAQAIDLSGTRILLVEDNDINAEIAFMILGQFGLTVERAENGLAGLEKVKNAGEGYYQAVLMDIQMPVMNGYEAVRAIRRLDGKYYQELPVIAMSANAYDEDVRDCLEAGMNAHIAKPFDPDKLMELLNRLINK